MEEIEVGHIVFNAKGVPVGIVAKKDDNRLEVARHGQAVIEAEFINVPPPDLRWLKGER